MRGLGASICQHNRVRRACKDCGGASICHGEHNRERSRCKGCGGACICEQGAGARTASDAGLSLPLARCCPRRNANAPRGTSCTSARGSCGRRMQTSLAAPSVSSLTLARTDTCSSAQWHTRLPIFTSAVSHTIATATVRLRRRGYGGHHRHGQSSRADDGGHHRAWPAPTLCSFSEE